MPLQSPLTPQGTQLLQHMGQTKTANRKMDLENQSMIQENAYRQQAEQLRDKRWYKQHELDTKNFEQQQQSIRFNQDHAERAFRLKEERFGWTREDTNQKRALEKMQMLMLMDRREDDRARSLQQLRQNKNDRLNGMIGVGLSYGATTGVHQSGYPASVSGAHNAVGPFLSSMGQPTQGAPFSSYVSGNNGTQGPWSYFTNAPFSRGEQAAATDMLVEAMGPGMTSQLTGVQKGDPVPSFEEYQQMEEAAKSLTESQMYNLWSGTSTSDSGIVQAGKMGTRWLEFQADLERSNWAYLSPGEGFEQLMEGFSPEDHSVAIVRGVHSAQYFDDQLNGEYDSSWGPDNTRGRTELKNLEYDRKKTGRGAKRLTADEADKLGTRGGKSGVGAYNEVAWSGGDITANYGIYALAYQGEKAGEKVLVNGQEYLPFSVNFVDGVLANYRGAILNDNQKAEAYALIDLVMGEYIENVWDSGYKGDTKNKIMEEHKRKIAAAVQNVSSHSKVILSAFHNSLDQASSITRSRQGGNTGMLSTVTAGQDSPIGGDGLKRARDTAEQADVLTSVAFADMASLIEGHISNPENNLILQNASMAALAGKEHLMNPYLSASTKEEAHLTLPGMVDRFKSLVRDYLVKQDSDFDPLVERQFTGLDSADIVRHAIYLDDRKRGRSVDDIGIDPSLLDNNFVRAFSNVVGFMETKRYGRQRATEREQYNLDQLQTQITRDEGRDAEFMRLMGEIK